MITKNIIVPTKYGGGADFLSTDYANKERWGTD
jgi:hypothetical protein